jgi:hypothetical protein
MTRAMRVGRSVLFLFSAMAGSAHASGNYELHTLYRDTRMKAMGGAGIALQLDDRDALQGVFTNPAQMAGNQGIMLHYLGGDIAGSLDSYTALGDVTAAFSNFSLDSLNALMGHNIYGNLQAVGGVTLPNFGVAVIADAQLGFYGENEAYPEFTVGYQTTTGIQAAWGMAFDLGAGGGGRTGASSSASSGSRRRPRRQNGPKSSGSSSAEAFSLGTATGSELRIGLGGKYLWRRGGYKSVPLSTLLSFDTAALMDLFGGWETGYGVDAGLQYVRSHGNGLSWSLASSATNIGSVNFSGSVADPVPGSLSAGGALRYSLGGISSATLAYDQNFLLTPTDWRKRSHLGAELDLPAVTIFGGYYQTYLSYGASFDLWVFRVTAATYAEELGAKAMQEGDRRYLLRFAMRLSL